MQELDFDPQIEVFLFFIALWAAMFGYLGWKYPGDQAESRARQVWAYADIVWLLVAVFAVAKILAPVEQALRDSNARAVSSGVLFLKNQVVWATWKAQDRFCNDIPVTDRDPTTCATLQKIERQYTKGEFDQIDALVIRRDFIPRLCQPCAPEISELSKAVETYRTANLEYSSQISRNIPNNTRMFAVSYLNLLLFTLALGLRFGRSIAEVRRNGLAKASVAVVS